MPWQHEPFLAERLERGRRLLAESEEHRGAADLQVGRAAGAAPGRAPSSHTAARRHMPATLPCLQDFIKDMDLTAELHCLFLGHHGQRRRDLTARHKQQVPSGASHPPATLPPPHLACLQRLCSRCRGCACQPHSLLTDFPLQGVLLYLRVALKRYSAPWLLEVMEDACAEAISNAVRMKEASKASTLEAIGGHAKVA